MTILLQLTSGILILAAFNFFSDTFHCGAFAGAVTVGVNMIIGRVLA